VTFAVPSDFEPFVAARVASRRYTQPEELFVDALQRSRDEAEFLDSLRQADAEIDRGKWARRCHTCKRA
jgi:hypothetical protein